MTGFWVLKAVLGKETKVEEAINSYIDNILVDEDVVLAVEIVDHVKKFWLKSKTTRGYRKRYGAGAQA